MPVACFIASYKNLALCCHCKNYWRD